MKKRKTSYVILDNENRWHSTAYDATPEQLRADIIEITERLAEANETPEELVIFQITGRPDVVKLDK